jgi:polyisoprenoid-binding protein YceI
MFRCIQHPVNKRDLCGAEASTAIKRSEWGLKRSAQGIGDDVRISIQIEAYRQQ